MFELITVIIAYDFNNSEMHRFLSMQRYTLSLSKSLDQNKCLQCRMRHLSTISTKTSIESSPTKIRKKRIKGNKKYAEILMVGESLGNGSSVEQRSIKVRTLRPDELGRLALSNLNLSELYKLKYIDGQSNQSRIGTEHTYNNLTDIDNLPTSKDTHVYSDFISDFLNMTSGPIVKYHFYNPPKRKEPTYEQPPLIQTNIVDQSEESRTLDILEEDLETELCESELEVELEPPDRPSTSSAAIHVSTTQDNQTKASVNAKIKAEIAVRTLTSYIDVCNSLKYSLRGLQALQYHRRRSAKCIIAYPTLTSSAAGVGTIYTGLLRGFAARGDLPHLEEVLRCAKEDGVPLPLDGHSAVFECLGRLVNHTKEYMLKEIRIATNALREAGLTYDDIINRGIFHNDQRKYVLQAMKRYNREYEPNYAPPTIQYKNKLVNGLNHPTQLKDPFLATRTNYHKRLNGPCSEANLQTAVTEQLDIEQNVYVKIRSIENSHKGNDAEVRRHRLNLERHRKLWLESAEKAVSRDLAALAARGIGGPLRFMDAYMRSIPAKDLVDILVTEAERIAQGSETYSPTTTQLYRDLGLKVWSRYRVLRRLRTGVQDSVTAVHREYCRKYYGPQHDVEQEHTPSEVDSVSSTINPRQAWQWLTWRRKQKSDASTEMEGREWPSTAVQHVGRFLYHIVMHDLKVDVNSLVQNNSKEATTSTSSNYLPAFYTVFRNQGSTSGGYSQVIKEEVKPHPILARLQRASCPTHLSFPSYELPMLCPPIPWLGVGAADSSSTPPGGYLMQPTDLMRLPPYAQAQRERLESADKRQLYPALDALNQLSAVPWQVNEPVLDIIMDVFRKGGDERLGVPESVTVPRSAADGTATSSDVGPSSLRQRLQLRRKKAEMYSLWCDCLYRLSLANHYRGRTFWLPHNLDFRGRTYPVPPHLSHLGSDLARSILVFAEARPLGPHGLDWLKLHLANLTGAKKRDPLEDRLRWVNRNIDEVLDSAENPLDGNRWWLEADEPWQALACCMEIARILRLNESTPIDLIQSRFPVHQDGSCNGLQHYAALGRDRQGAHSVNLSANVTEPQDVYSSVAALVEEKREKDAEQGHVIAKVLKGFVKRKVIKQTVMTTVYGVTRFGARLQIARQLKDLSSSTAIGPQFPREHVWAASSYLTTRTFESLRSMFNSAREIQDWFTDCARLISSVGGKTVEWRTPLGLPIVQPYCRLRAFNGNGGDKAYAHFTMDKHERPNVMKQKNAFPPNFIHSLDSSHMMLTSLWAERAPITFVSVHDCYWTHPSTVDIMNRLCREQFVALHSEPILEDLSNYFCDLYSYNDCDFLDDGSVSDLTKKKLNRILNKMPNTGTFDINEVLRSTYFFS